jgi:uncharacterized RDD family membrane protein YckC
MNASGSNLMTAPAKLDTLQSVELAEGVEIRLRIAGPLPRASAYLIDLLIRVLLLLLGIIASSMLGMALGGRVANGLMLLAWFLLDWLYPVVFEAGRRGATPGKRLMGLRVVQASGSPLTLGQAVVRNFLRFIDGMPLFTYAFGMTSCLATRRFQRLGDLAAGTLVVYSRVSAPTMPAAGPAPDPMPVPVALTADETRALALFEERAALWPQGRRTEIANHASALSGATGGAGVKHLLAMARWLREKRG